jgi:hypothetical protein
MPELRRRLWSSALVVAFCLVVVQSAPAAQEPEPNDDQTARSERSAGSSRAAKTGSAAASQKPSPPPAKGSRWERLRDSVWPFRAKGQGPNSGTPAQSGSSGDGPRDSSAKNNSKVIAALTRKTSAEPTSTREQPRTRWLVGRDIRYAPGVDPDSPPSPGAEADPSLSQASHSAIQATGPTAVAGGSSSNAASLDRMTDHAAGAQDQPGAPPSSQPPTPEASGDAGQIVVPPDLLALPPA